MSAIHETPDKSSLNSQEHAPQVIVRAGKTYVCSSCGTLVEIPAEFVGQMVTVKAEPPPTEPSSETPVDAAPREVPSNPKPRRQPKRKTLAGQVIDGLTVPSVAQLKEAQSWTAFHQKVLDRQNRELVRLLESGRKGPSKPVPIAPLPVVPRHAQEDVGVVPGGNALDHAHADVGMVPAIDNGHTIKSKGREPP